jgi:glycolate oxidase FAD binding subunit
MDVSQFTDQLHTAAPQTEILTSAADLAHFAVDGVTPYVAALPATIEEVAAIMKLASARQVAVLPLGNSTDVALGQPPTQYDLALCTTRLNALLEHEAADLTCSMQAGITLANLQQRLGAKGQFLALDPPNAEQSTIGGILAANLSGPQRLRYGSARDLVIGLRVVLGDGTIARSGGKVVKNVAGYDLNKLYIGSLGTLGIIVEANFKLIPKPEQEQTLLVSFKSPSAALEMVTNLLSSVVMPVALELIDPAAQKAFQQHIQQTLPGASWLLAIAFAGVTKAVARQIADTRQAAKAHQGTPFGLLEADAHTNFWEVLRQQQTGPVICKVSLLINEVAHFLESAHTISQEHLLEASAIAHAGSGIIYLQLGPADETVALARAISQLRLLAERNKGSLIVTCAPPALKGPINIWGTPRPDMHLMQLLKQKFDPTGALVRGRFVGGL